MPREDFADDPLRRDLVERARRFRSSWVEMAEGLIEVQRTRSFERWGYGDLYEYCASELKLRRATVDKLTGSYSVMERHAPEALRGEVVPSQEAVAYFGRAVESAPPPDDDGAPTGDDGLLSALRRAVFEDAQPVSTLKRRFDAALTPKPDERKKRDALERLVSQARRLLSLLSECQPLDDDVRSDAESTLARLEADALAKLAELSGDADEARPARRRGKRVAAAVE